MSLKRILALSIFHISILFTNAQTGTDFWLAPPEVTDLHGSPGGEPIYVLVTSQGDTSTVIIEQPANPGFNGGSPITITLSANESRRINMTPFKADLETDSTDYVMNTGLHIYSSNTITAYYEVSRSNNPDIWALKGENSLGTEFYIPLHKHIEFDNHVFSAPHEAYASFDIVATEDNTTITIYSTVQVDGHAAGVPFNITLNRGQTYSCAWTGANYNIPTTHPGGASLISDKPIAVSIKDDSNHNPSGGCYDLMGDQIVPLDVVSTDYIVVKGSLNSNGDESVFLTGTDINTNIYINGSTTPIATIFAGQVYRIDIDSLDASPNNAMYITTSKPVYATHVTGFGCEQGIAQLPPLNCAGSSQVSFVRSTSEGFFLTILVRSTAVNAFSITGNGTATIDPGDFITVPGTGGEWVAARIQFNTTEIPVDSTFLITNTTDVFALGIINGGGSSGCRYGYFSEFQAKTFVDAGPNKLVCANTNVELSGSVTGSTLKGEWTTNGTGTFVDSSDVDSLIYIPSSLDITIGTINFTLNSVGPCFPESDTMTVTFTPAPTAEAGDDINVCAASPIASLNGAITVSAGGEWSGGNGSFTPNINDLNATYTPTGSEITSGSVTLTLTSIGNGDCNPVFDSVTIFYNPGPIVDAGEDETTCFNDLDINLSGSVIGGTTTGRWSTLGSGNFSPHDSTLNVTYTASSADSINGGADIILTSTNNGACQVARDTMRINIFGVGTSDAGTDATVCANNASVALNGNVFGAATGGVWSTNGTGDFTPNVNNLNATYEPSASDITQDSIFIILTANSCDLFADSLTLKFSPAPVVNAGNNVLTCVDDLTINLNGSISGATNTGKWSTSGTGTFTPNDSTLNAVYNASSADSINGGATLVLTSTNVGNCIVVTDTLLLEILEEGIVNVNADDSVCANSSFMMTGNVTGGASKGIWTTTGTGTFLPSDTTLNATYVPSASDVILINLNIKLTATNSCNEAKDSFNLKVTPGPTVNAGVNRTVCANNADVALNGNITVSSGGIWSGGSGSFNPDNTTLNATYSPTQSEINSGQVKLYLTTTGNMDCNPEVDSMEITFSPAPNVSAGIDQDVCITGGFAQLNGSVSGGASTGVWSTLGDGNFSNDSVTAPAYSFGDADTTAGSVDLIFTSTFNAGCNAESDTMTITFGPTVFVYAGEDQFICDNNLQANISGLVSGGATKGIWSSNGTGSFSPNDSTLNASYILSDQDSANGSISITLISTDHGLCNANEDSMEIVLEQSPSVNAGSDQTICPGATIQLTGTFTNTSGVRWSTDGDGTFIPNDSTANAVYSPGELDSISGNATLTITSLGQETCVAATDQVNINIDIPLIADFNFGTFCENQAGQFTDNTLVVTGIITDWDWDFGDNSNVFQENPTHVYDSTGSYNVRLTVTSSQGCDDSKTKTIFVNPSPDANFTTTIGCFEDSVLFEDSSSIVSGTINSWRWSFFDGDTIGKSGELVRYKYDEAQDYDITLTVGTPQGCSNNTTKSITILPQVVANFEYDSTIDLRAQELISFTSTSNGATSWDWDFGDNSVGSNNEDPNYLYEEEGTYTVNLKVENNIGCEDEIEVDITILEAIVILPPAVPDAFSPNGDGQNDTLFVRGGPFKALEFKIYNQWGELLFETIDANSGWTGLYESVLQPMGVYAYTLTAITEEDEETFNMSGSVSIIK